MRIDHGGQQEAPKQTLHKFPPPLQAPDLAPDLTPTAGLLWTEPTEAALGGFSSGEGERAAQRLQPSDRPVRVRWRQRVCWHESVAIAVQHHVPGLQATPLFTAVQHLIDESYWD